MNIRLQKHILDEVTNPTGLFIDTHIIAISHDYYAQFHARDINLRKKCVSLYNKTSLELIGHFNHARYPINHVAFHPEKTWVLIATGSYDGGYFYEGELILWNYTQNDYKSLLTDTREVTSCQFIAGMIEFTISPIDDETDTFQSETYTIAESTKFPVHLTECKKIATTSYEGSPYDETNQVSLIQQINEYAKQHDKTYVPSYMAWDMVFINEHTLAVGLNNGIVEIWDIEKASYQTIKLAPQGSCTQLFYDPDLNNLTVNIASWDHFPDGNRAVVYQIDLNTYKAKQVFSGNTILSKNKSGLFLGRQTNFQRKADCDILFNAEFAIIWKKDFGHYDLFNHYIRIDGHEHFFVLIGTPKNQHTHKRLIEIEPEKGVIVSEIKIDPNDKHYMYLCAILLNDHFVIQAKIYNSNPYAKQSYVLFAINKHTQNKIWQYNIPAQVIAFCPSSTDQQIIASLTNGEIWIIDILTGETIKKLNKTNPCGFPLSLARNKNKLAIGYDDGTVELLQL